MRYKKRTAPGLRLSLAVAVVALCSANLAAVSGCGDFGNTELEINLGELVSTTLHCEVVEVMNKGGQVVVRIAATEEGDGRLTIFNAQGEEIAALP